MKKHLTLADLRHMTAKQAQRLLAAFHWFVQHGGKRPFVHAADGRIILAMCQEAVPILEKVAGVSMRDVQPQETERQRLRAVRRERHKENRKRRLQQAKPQPIKLEPKAREQLREELAEEIAETDGDMPILFKKMSDGHTTVLLLIDGPEQINKANAFKLEKIGGVVSRMKNAVKHRTRDDLLAKGWKKSTIVNFPQITELRASEEVVHLEHKLRNAA